jgi:hypothetical protein
MDMVDALAAVLIGIPLVSWLAACALEYVTNWFHDWKEGVEEWT